MSIVDLKRHPDGETPAISRSIVSSGDLGVRENSRTERQAPPNTAGPPGVPDGVHTCTTPEPDRLVSQPRLEPGSQVTRISEGGRRCREVGIDSRCQLRRARRPRLERKAGPHLPRQLEPPHTVRELRLPEVLDRQTDP